ncbi:helix-turn-helix domain-containing protein [Streptomyces sp. NPDC127040]|uniref:helix-turn-helix domain-containing protein n=1 Tax=Streptomyces sp. NPDC127040 TaxID=3347116 RepID=UPI00364D1EC6
MAYDWIALGREIRNSRIAQGMTQGDLAAAAGVSRASLQNLERGAVRTRVPTSLRAVTDALGWASTAASSILQGDSGAPVAPHLAGSDSASDLPLRVQQELQDGPLLDAMVIDLSNSGARMVVVVKGKTDATPAELRRDLLAWVKAQQVLDELGASPSDD